MTFGKLNYAYRLSVARLVILRMRWSRLWQRKVRSRLTSSSTGSRQRIFPRMLFLCVLSGVIALTWFASQRSLDSGRSPDSHIATQMETTPDIVPESVRSGVAEVHEGADEDSYSESLLDAQLALKSKVADLERSLIIRESENTSLKSLLNGKVAETAALENEIRDLKRQIQLFEQEKAQLETQLREQALEFVDARRSWEASNTEHKVVYNITNIPVGSHVPEYNLNSGEQSVTDEPAGEDILAVENPDDYVEPSSDTQAYTFPFGADVGDVNSSDPYAQYRDTTGDEVRWKGDDFLSDSLRNGLSEEDSVLLEPGSTLESYEADLYDEPVEHGSSFLGTDIVRQEPFYGPAPDQYENLIEPGLPQ